MFGDGFPWDLFFIALIGGIILGKNKAILLREEEASAEAKAAAEQEQIEKG